MIRKSARKKTARDAVSSDLLLALEWARTQLAIAIAAEAKWTTLERRQYYLETADQMRWFIRKLRTSDNQALLEYPDWHHALRAIRQLPVQGRALRLCQILRDIVSKPV